MNPGHSLEAMWFIMNLGVRLDDRALIDKAVKIALNTAEYGWDKEYGGIFYFLDRKGAPAWSWNGTRSSGGCISNRRSR